MQELFPTVLVIIVAVSAGSVLASRASRIEARALWLSLLCHLAFGSAKAYLNLNYYGTSDMSSYHFWGSWVAEQLFNDFGSAFPDTVRYILMDETVPFPRAGSATGAMTGWAALVIFAVGGSSLYAAGAVLSAVSCFAKFAIYGALSRALPSAQRWHLLLAVLMVPSAVYWTSGLEKESMAMIGLGPLVAGGGRLVRGEGRLAAGFMMVLGALIIGTTKAYFLFAFGAAASAAIYVEATKGGAARRASSLGRRVFSLSIALAVGVVAMQLLGSLFPRFSLQNIAEEAAHLQQVGARVSGGSSFEGVGVASPDEGLPVYLFPLALVASLGRPFLPEAHNALALVTSLEITFLLSVLLLGLWRLGGRGYLRACFSSGVVMFLSVFVLVVGVGVGLTTTNMGTLSRYRAPMLPFYGSIVVVIYALARSTRRTRAPARGPADRRENETRYA